MRRLAAPIALIALLPACSGLPQLVAAPGPDAAPQEATRPQARPPALGTPPPPEGARTAEEFDTTSAEERAAAAAAPAGGDSSLGTVVVSLGDVSRTGFWLETPLVTRERPGRVTLPGGGASAQVTLIPAAEGTGSRLSLAAMRLLGVPLTDLPTVEVFTEAT